eukprot:scaffold311583_cov24-Tisochrysis_lutea.AAC.2
MAVTTPPHSITPKNTKAETRAFSTSNATTAVVRARRILTGSSPQTFVPSACAAVKTCEMAAGPMPSITILYVARDSADAVVFNACIALPTPSCTANPTQSNSQKARRPPKTPALEMPIAVAICVEVGPGIAWQSDMSSMKRCSSSHLRFPSTKVLRNRPMCACGPPKATNPMGRKAVATSHSRAPYVAAVCSIGCSAGCSGEAEFGTASGRESLAESSLSSIATDRTAMWQR